MIVIGWLRVSLRVCTAVRIYPVCCPVSKVILDLKGSEFNYTYQTPPASPSSTLSRKSSISRCVHSSLIQERARLLKERATRAAPTAGSAWGGQVDGSKL